MKNIFISYSTLDKEKVRKVKRDIQASGHSVWMYPEAIDIGTDILTSESNGISECDFVFLMISKNSRGAIAVQNELKLINKEETRSARKKLIEILIDPNMPIDNDTIQKCDLSNKNTYASEFSKLIRKIETHTNFRLQYQFKEDEETNTWFEIDVWVEGEGLDKVTNVDYYIHRKIAKDTYTRERRRKRDKNFCITFYSPHNEFVYAVVSLKDGTEEELRIHVKTT